MRRARSSFNESTDDACLTPWDVQSRRIYSWDGVWPTLYGGDGGGKGYVMEPMPSLVLKVRGGSPTYVKVDGSKGTAGKGALVGEEVAYTVAATQDQTLFDGRSGEYIIRRLTPLETERLQGFPDGHTDLRGCDVDAVTEKVAASLGYDEKQKYALRRKVAKWSKETPDAPRYKATGNSMAVPCIRWIGERIKMVQDIIDEGGAS